MKDEKYKNLINVLVSISELDPIQLCMVSWLGATIKPLVLIHDSRSWQSKHDLKLLDKTLIHDVFSIHLRV